MGISEKRRRYLSKYQKTEKYKNYQKNYRAKNKEKVAEYQRKYQKKVRLQILELLGNKCRACGFDDYRALQVDHVNGGGRKEYTHTIARGSYNVHLLKKISSGSKDYQLLCANCNWIKRYENNELN